MRRAITSGLEVGGGGLFVWGWWMLAPWLGAVVAGVLLVVVAVALEQGADE